MIATFLYRNPRLLVLTIGVAVVAGLNAYYVLPRMEDPVLTRRVAIVNTSFPGADARRVESLVTEALEQALQEIGEIKELLSASRPSNSTIVIELRDEIVDVAPVWSRVRDALVDVAPALPAGADPPSFRELELKAYAAIVALKWNRSTEANYAILQRLAEELTHAVQSVPGSEQVDLFGDPGVEVLVEVDPAILASLGLTCGNISQQIQQSDMTQSAGMLRGKQNELWMEIDQQVDSLKRLGDTPIQYGQEGRFVSLAEISSISKGTVQPPKTLALVDAQPAVVLAAFVRDQRRIDHWTDRLQAALDEYAGRLPSDVELDVIFAQNDYVEHRLDRLLGNLMLGTAAVMAVTLVLMGWRSMLIVGTALPLSALMVLAGMRLMQIPIHQMSVTGLIIALGLLIDNAIVIVDEVRSRLWSGLKPAEAIADGVRHLAMPLFGSTLTTTLAFAPIALLPGAPGEFVRAIAISVILAINASFLLAMTVVPALTAMLQPTAADHRTFWRHGLSSQLLTGVYAKSLLIVFRMPWLGIALGILLPVIGFIQASTLPEQFFPAADRDQIQIEIELASSASLSETQRVARGVRDAALEHDQVDCVHWFLGESAPTFFYNVVPRRFDSAFYGQALVELAPRTNARDIIQSLQADLDARFTQCRVLVRQLEQGPPFDAPVEIRLFGPDLETLQQLGSQVRMLLSQTREVLHTRSDLEESVPKLSMQVDEAEAKLAGLNAGEIVRQLYSTVEGSVGGSLSDASGELPIRVRLSNRARGSLDQMSTLHLQPWASRGPSAAVGPSLSALTGLKLTSDVATISHINGQRMNEVKAYITAGTLPAQVLSEFERRMAAADFQLPAGYTMQYGGEAAKHNEAVGNLRSEAGVLIALMLATLVVSFRSFRIALIIAAVGGMSIGLGLFALWSFEYPFGFMAILGTMGLVGVAINDGIVVMAGIREHPLARQGDVQALCEVVISRSRHVIATSLTTIAGFTPLVLAGGGFWPPLAIAIAGGVGGATLLALYFVPALYLICYGGKQPADRPIPITQLQPTR